MVDLHRLWRSDSRHPWRTEYSVWPMAVLVGFITSVVMAIIAIVAVHPWIRRLIRNELPKLEATLAESHALQRAATQLALSENDAELRRLAAKRDSRMQEAVTWRNNAAKELNEKVKQEMTGCEPMLRRAGSRQEQLNQSLRAIDLAGSKRHQENEAAYAAAPVAARGRLGCAVRGHRRGNTPHEMQGNARMRAATQKASSWLDRSCLWCKEHFPDWHELAHSPTWPRPLPAPVLTLGYADMTACCPKPRAVTTIRRVVAPLNFETLSRSISDDCYRCGLTGGQQLYPSPDSACAYLAATR